MAKAATAIKSDATTRERVIEAAREMLQDENAKFSMRLLADRAGVSLATPYNLFGSKQGIIGAVMDLDLQQLGQSMASIEATPLEIFFPMLDVVADMLDKSPQFYKAGALSLEGDGGGQLQYMMSAPRHVFIKALVDRAIDEGFLFEQVDSNSLALVLGQQMYGWIQSWAKDQVGLEELRLRSCYGLALSLCAVTTQHHRSAMQKRVFDYQTQIKKLRNRIDDKLKTAVMDEQQ